MTLGQTISVYALGLVALFTASRYVLRKFFRAGHAVSFSSAYLLFILLLSCQYFSLGSHDAQAVLFWMIPGILSLPTSLCLFLLPDLTIGDSGIPVLLGIIGIVQYGGIGWIIDRVIDKQNERSRTTRQSSKSLAFTPSAKL